MSYLHEFPDSEPTEADLAYLYGEHGPITIRLEPRLERTTPTRATDGHSFIFGQPSTAPAIWGTDGGEILWSPGESMMICGPDGVGKTTVMQQGILGRLGIIQRLLGQPIESCEGNVLYLAMDRPKQAARSMRRMVDEATHGNIIQSRLDVWEGPLPIDVLRSANTLSDWVQDVFPQAQDVFIDSMKDVMTKVSDDEQGSRYNLARQELLARGLNLVESHHQRKQQHGSGPPNGLADVYGSRWLTAGAGSVFVIWGKAGEAVQELHHVKQPVDMFGPHKIIHDHSRGNTQLYEPADLLEVLRRYTKHGISVSDGAAHLYPGDTAPTRNEIERARRKLEGIVKAGNARKAEDATGASRYYPNEGA